MFCRFLETNSLRASWCDDPSTGGRDEQLDHRETPLATGRDRPERRPWEHCESWRRRDIDPSNSSSPRSSKFANRRRRFRQADSRSPVEFAAGPALRLDSSSCDRREFPRASSHPSSDWSGVGNSCARRHRSLSFLSAHREPLRWKRGEIDVSRSPLSEKTRGFALGSHPKPMRSNAVLSMSARLFESVGSAWIALKVTPRVRLNS